MDVFDILDRLVAFPSVAGKPNGDIAGWIKTHLAEHGTRVTVLPGPEGDRSNLFATIGPADVPGYILSGHMDVVPAGEPQWSSAPFSLRREGECLYGRGTTDMKGFLAAALAAVPMLAGLRLARPIHLAFSYDEEVGCTGVRPMIAELGKRLPLPRLVFVGEPTEMGVVDAHKGPVRWRVELTGRAAHSSMPHYGVNAIAYAGRLLGELLRIEEELKVGAQDPRFDPPFTTLQITQIEGGTASNVVPVPCWFGWEIRGLPGFDPMLLDRRLKAFAAEQCLPEMRRLAPEAQITIRATNQVAAYAADTQSGIVPLALKLAGKNKTYAVSYCTEAGLFQVGGAPAIVCGPGNIAQAHTANEFLSLAELEKCLVFLDRLADWAEA